MTDFLQGLVGGIGTGMQGGQKFAQGIQQSNINRQTQQSNQMKLDEANRTKMAQEELRQLYKNGASSETKDVAYANIDPAKAYELEQKNKTGDSTDLQKIIYLMIKLKRLP